MIDCNCKVASKINIPSQTIYHDSYALSNKNSNFAARLQIHINIKLNNNGKNKIPTQLPPDNVRDDGSSNPAVSGGCPPEKSAIKTLTDGIKRQVPFAIEHSISADQINIEYLSLQDLLQGMDESERKEVQPLVDGMILAWHERREKDVISKFKHTTSIMATRSTRHVFEQ